MACYRRLREPFPWEKLRQLRLHRLTGRCSICRQVGAWIRRWLSPAAAALHLTRHAAPTSVAGLLIEEAVRNLRAFGIHQGYRLEPSMTSEIANYAVQTPCMRAPDDDERFLFTEICGGRTPRGMPVAVADVDLSRRCAAIEALSRDALLLEVAERYLGYPPTSVIARLFWSPASRLSADTRRRNGQTIDYHYDIDPARSLYFYFYLTLTDRTSGAHVVLPGTHLRKPMSIVLASAFQCEERLLTLYPAVRPLVVEGGPGFGFVEDPACFHKALAPETADRLILQFRYS